MKRALLTLLLVGCGPGLSKQPLDVQTETTPTPYCVRALTTKGRVWTTCAQSERECEWAAEEARQRALFLELRYVGSCRKVESGKWRD